MAKTTLATDRFANLAVISVTESAANTLTFKKLETGIALFEKLAWIIHRVEYYLQLDLTQFAASLDEARFGLATTDQITTPTVANQSVLDRMIVRRLDMGTAATGVFVQVPFVKDFTNLPGGGLIVPPNPLYGWVQGAASPAAHAVDMRLFYTNYVLKPEEYWELVEARRIISSS